MMDPFGQSLLRFAVFFGFLIALAIFEIVRPRRRVSVDKVSRWLTNLTLVSIDLVVLRLMAALSVPLAAIAAATYAEAQGIGLFNVLGWPPAVEMVLALVALDFAVWLQHVASHKVPLFWRLHQVHHADRDIDVTTGIRFHPIEIGLSMMWKIVCVLALGVSPLAVLLFEVILNAGALFSHANIALPEAVDSALRRVIVTPDMHRVHHSIEVDELNSNFGFNLSVWDRIFGTYRGQPEKGHQNMTIGLSAYQSNEPQKLGWSLGLPFRRTSN
jgi:sterol desaturase/sphingolipid hydroxylase (fatty acid hydroxylase superfamily)